MRSFLLALLLVLAVALTDACDVSFNIDMNLSGVVCEVLNPESMVPPDMSFDIPRGEGEPCNAVEPCYARYVCACTICVDPRDIANMATPDDQ